MELWGVTEVRAALKVGENRARTIIRQCNEELAAKGYMVIRGKVSRKYFEERFYK